MQNLPTNSPEKKFRTKSDIKSLNGGVLTKPANKELLSAIEAVGHFIDNLSKALESQKLLIEPRTKGNDVRTKGNDVRVANFNLSTKFAKKRLEVARQSASLLVGVNP